VSRFFRPRNIMSICTSSHKRFECISGSKSGERTINGDRCTKSIEFELNNFREEGLRRRALRTYWGLRRPGVHQGQSVQHASPKCLGVSPLPSFGPSPPARLLWPLLMPRTAWPRGRRRFLGISFSARPSDLQPSPRPQRLRGFPVSFTLASGSRFREPRRRGVEVEVGR
jgi:hypothetical protein